MRPTLYKLVDRIPVPVEEMGVELQSSDERRVALTNIGDTIVSTVFLQIDHAWEGQPLLFETMVFEGIFDMESERTSTWDEAVEAHERMCERVRQGAGQ